MARLRLPHDQELPAQPGQAVGEVLQERGFPAMQPCGGNGRCGRCRMHLAGDLDPVTAAERRHLSPAELDRGMRLACQAVVRGTVWLSEEALFPEVQLEEPTGDAAPAPMRAPVVKRRPVPGSVPDDHSASLLEYWERQLEEPLRAELDVLQELAARGPESRAGEPVVVLTGRHQVLGLEPEGKPGPLVLALDLGTTTLQACLLDPANGLPARCARVLNPQAAWGGDVITRIGRTGEPGGLETLRDSLRSGVQGLVDRLLQSAGGNREQVLWVAAAANTAVLHLWLGVDPAGLGKHPFVPAWRDSLCFPAREIGLRLHPRARVETLPVLGGFVGADAVAASLAVELGRDEETALLLDLGTNGELILASGGRLWAASAAVGPAFEGGGISAGMPAVAGAAEHVDWDGKSLRLRTRGGEEPLGLCGSGLVELLALARREGWMNAAGKVLSPGEAGPGAPVTPGKQGYDLELGPGDSLRLTQSDIRRLQLAKGAVGAAAETLLKHAGVEPRDLERVLVAGAFGSHLEPRAAMELGLLPSVPVGTVEYAGNAASRGAQLAATHRHVLAEARQQAQIAQHLDLAAVPEFRQAFAAHMRFQPWG